MTEQKSQMLAIPDGPFWTPERLALMEAGLLKLAGDGDERAAAWWVALIHAESITAQRAIAAEIQTWLNQVVSVVTGWYQQNKEEIDAWIAVHTQQEQEEEASDGK